MTTDEKVENDIGLAKGGNKVANQAFVNFYENRKERAY